MNVLWRMVANGRSSYYGLDVLDLAHQNSCSEQADWSPIHVWGIGLNRSANVRYNNKIRRVRDCWWWL